ncbi:MAG: hypothetical protein IBJ19_08495 [Gemmatimonadaceae bacterium]|nr:hypothetical protein [Gemmatimonadaceae bacterium]
MTQRITASRLRFLRIRKRRIALALGAVLLLVVAGVTAWWWSTSPTRGVDRRLVVEELRVLKEQRDALQAELEVAQQYSALLDRRPEGDVLLALPTPFVQRMVTGVIVGWFDRVDLHLTNLRVRKQGEVKARLGLLGRRRVGSYSLRLDVSDLRGRLEPGAPTLSFGGDTIGIVLPVRLSQGEGRGRMTFEWDSRGLANMVCGDLTTAENISGTVIPADYVARGRLKLSASNGGVLIDPDFPGLQLRLRIKPSAASVRALERTLADKSRLCDMALERANVEERILALVGRGFPVRIPQKFFRAVRLPVAIEGALPMADKRVEVRATPDTLVITPQAVWLAARIDVRRSQPSPP